MLLALRQRQAYAREQIYQGQPKGEGIPLIIVRHKKTVFSMAWVKLTLVVCYIPYIISVLTIRMNAIDDRWGGISGLVVWEAFFLNSTLKPILYCLQITEVRKAVKDTVRQFFAHRCK